MCRVLAAARTELVELETVFVVVAVLFGSVIPLLANGAGERDDDSTLFRFGCQKLLLDAGDGAGADGAATLTDGETQTGLNGDGGNQLDLHLDVVARHDHLDPLR